MKPKFRIYSCQKCGKQVFSLTHSLLGLDQLKKEVGLYCGECASPEVHHKIDMTVLEKLSGFKNNLKNT
jgi:DNA-directed RNA polymerase subunit RPC12/RpoP